MPNRSCRVQSFRAHVDAILCVPAHVNAALRGKRIESLARVVLANRVLIESHNLADCVSAQETAIIRFNQTALVVNLAFILQWGELNLGILRAGEKFG